MGYNLVVNGRERDYHNLAEEDFEEERQPKI